MKAIAKRNILNAAKPTIDKWVVLPSDKKSDKANYKLFQYPNYFCKKDEEIEIITKNAGAWCIVVVARNNKGESFVINWNDLTIPLEDIEFSLE